MKKLRFFIHVILLLALTLQTALPAAAIDSLTVFSPTRIYTGEFDDVADNAWFYPYVTLAYEYGIMNGPSPRRFLPDNKITLAEVIKIAAVIHKTYHTGSAYFEPYGLWYTPYLDYAHLKGILQGSYKDYNAEATRADFALIMARALPGEALTPINRVDDGAIPDVYENFSYGAAVYKLYRAGILFGSDKKNSFYPLKPMKRAEAAAAVSRMLDSELRVPFELITALTPEEVFEHCSPAVFYLEVFDDEGEVVKTGSGFFIDESGLAVTNFHVISGARSAEAVTSDGEVFTVSGIYDYDSKKDVALIQVEGSGFPVLETADAGELITGETIYTIGSPLGMQNTFSKGIISGLDRSIKDLTYIQLDAFISPGSSGGALIDSAGRVVGITSAAVDGGQSLNLAVPVNLIAALSGDELMPLGDMTPNVPFYKNFGGVPDFGAIYDVKTFHLKDMGSNADFSYLVSELPRDASALVEEYIEILNKCLFNFSGNYLISGYEFSAFYSRSADMFVMIGINKVNGKDCVTISVS